MDKKLKSNVKSRVVKTGILTTILFLSLVLRLFWIQIIRGREYELLAEKQYVRGIQVAPARGNIFDRNNIKLTNNKKEDTIYIFKDAIFNSSEYINKLKEALILTDEDIEAIKKSKSRVIEIPLKVSIDKAKTIEGVIVETKVLRYDGRNLLSHVIGYTKKSENIGEYGIEKIYDDILKANNEIGYKYVVVDGKQRIIPGINDILVNNEKRNIANSVKLTVDIRIQRALEEIIDNKGVDGAFIVTEVETGDILAMASRPNLNQNNIEYNLNSNKMDFYNKALEVSYPPGSIFKTVVLLSALEEELFSHDDQFLCEGYVDFGSFRINCNNTEGHGELNLYEAFSNSCNSAFIQIGKELGAQKIVDMARRLGFESKVQDILIETAGNLPKDDELFGPAIGNISIGQINIEVTPIQVTNMMMIIANNGIEKDINIVDSIVTEEGMFAKKVQRDEDRRVLPKALCLEAKKYLEGVVDIGTAKDIDFSAIGGAAGKTGSAENGKENTHAWFSGYFPRNAPKYVITVLVEEGGSGSKVAVPIFEEIAKQINEIYQLDEQNNE